MMHACARTSPERVLQVLGQIRRKGHTMTEEALRAEWKAIDLVKQREERPLISTAAELFRDQKTAVLEKLPDALAAYMPLAAPAPALRKDPLLVSRIFDLAYWKTETAKRFAPQTLLVFEQGFQNGLARIAASGIDFTSSDPFARQVLTEVLWKTSGINDATVDALTQIIQHGLVSGHSMDAIVRAVGDQMTGWAKWRAETVGRTAGIGAFEGGQQKAFVDAGVQTKRWLSQRDLIVRRGKYDHLLPDGQEVDVSGSFEVSGELLRFPGDPQGSAGNVIRCRCTSLPVIK